VAVETLLTLKDGRSVAIRPMRPDDFERSYGFFCALPEEDRKYLRVDVTQRNMVAERAANLDPRRVVRLVAVHGEEIVADGALELAGHGWGDNVAEIRLIVARPFQRAGLGTRMARELFFLAADRKVDRIVARMMGPQLGARNIFRRLGFKQEFVIPQHVRDRSGVWQDMVIMRCALEELWREMELEVESSDWRSHR
jgi:acetyltransferase